MPMVNFICPDGESIRIESCLEKCRMTGRCVTLPTLMLMAKRRLWKGKISTTQAIKGTRLAYLEIMEDYGEKPVDRAFALLGTFHHLKMQNVQVPETLTEEWMEDELGTGMFDTYDASTKTLYDYKTAGSYKVNRALGKKKVTVDVPTGEVYKSGKREGEPKTKKESTWSMGTPDRFEWEMQLSRYAYMLEDAGFPVNEIVVQVTVRDFTRMTGKMYGLDRQIYLIRMDKLPKDFVEAYYAKKSKDLLFFLDKEIQPPPCSPSERWLDEGAYDNNTVNTLPGTRCSGFCPVWTFCDLGIRGHQEVANDEREPKGAVPDTGGDASGQV